MMKRYPYSIALFLAVLVVGACATVPTGPSVMVLPPAGKPFEQFRAEDATCRQWAQEQVGLSPQQAINQNTATGAVGGAAMGALLGTAIGAASHEAGYGAAIGAAAGLLLGTSQGANAGAASGADAQRRYDIAYQQCMYAYGNIIPGVRQTPRTMPPPPPPPQGEGYPSPESSQPPLAPPLGGSSPPPEYSPSPAPPVQ